MNQQTFDLSGYSGKQNQIPSMKIEPELETVENVYQDRDYQVKLDFNEFSSVCPKTGLPDFALILIEYVPDRFLVEQKSLKLYLTAYRNIGIFQEHAANKILDDFVKAVEPKKVIIQTEWNARGGIGTFVEAEWSRE